MLPRFSTLVAVLVLLASPRSGPADPAGTLDRLVQKLGVGLTAATGKRPLGRIDLGFTVRQGAEVSPKLRRMVRDLLLARLNARGFRSVAEMKHTGTFDERRKRAGVSGHEMLVDLELEVVAGYLHLRGLLVPTDRQLWRDTLQPERGALSHLHARVRVDAEVRGYLGSVSGGKLSFSLRRHKHNRRQVLSMTVGDVDGDGRQEVAVLEPFVLRVLRYRPRRQLFGPQVYRKWLVKTSASLRPRRRVGSVLTTDADGNGRVELPLRTSEMSQGAIFELEGKVLHRKGDLAGYPLAARRTKGQVEQLLGLPRPGQDLFDAAQLTGTLAWPGLLPFGAQSPLPPTFYNLVTTEVASGKGQRQRYLAVVDSNGKLGLFREGQAGAVLELPQVGVAVDLVDLDDDGAVELVTTSSDDMGTGKDHLEVHQLDPATNTHRLLWRSGDLGGAVTALTHGDIDGDGKLELLGAVFDNDGWSHLVVFN